VQLSSFNRDQAAPSSRRPTIDEVLSANTNATAPERRTPKFHRVWSAIDRGCAVLSKEN